MAAAVAYVVITAGVQALTTRYQLADLWLPRLLDVLIAGWLFWVGSSVGSFLNVVAWRMPRGRNINGFSHCPWCNQRLSARDNWPVFGWLVLRGRCRTCRLPISPRYPLIELCVGLSITAVGLPELYRGLNNLPYLAMPGRHDPLAMPMVSWPVIGIWVYHSVALASSWAVGLVRWDGHRLPARLSLFCAAVVVLPMLVWWQLGVVTWRAGWSGGAPEWSLLDAAMRLLTALVAAVLVGRSLARYLCPAADPKFDPVGGDTQRLIDLITLLLLPAVVVGWQAFLTVVLLAAALAALLLRSARRTRPFAWGQPADGMAWFAFCLPIGLTLQLVTWRWTESWGYLPATQSPPWVILVAAGLLLVLPAGLKKRPETPDRAAAEDLR